MKVINQIARYLNIHKKDGAQNETAMLKYMHGINRISLHMFLVALLMMLARAIARMF